MKAFYLNRDKAIKKLQEAAEEAMLLFPEIKEIRLVGSVARGELQDSSNILLEISTETPRSVSNVCSKSP